MQKNKPTNKNQNYNEDILDILNSTYGYSQDYIRKCLRGDRKGQMPDKIVADYNRMAGAAMKAIKEAAKQ